jgi:hypothetical protein
LDAQQCFDTNLGCRATFGHAKTNRRNVSALDESA